MSKAEQGLKKNLVPPFILITYSTYTQGYPKKGSFTESRPAAPHHRIKGSTEDLIHQHRGLLELI